LYRKEAAEEAEGQRRRNLWRRFGDGGGAECRKELGLDEDDDEEKKNRKSGGKTKKRKGEKQLDASSSEEEEKRRGKKKQKKVKNFFNIKRKRTTIGSRKNTNL
jgi:hypothetical protein